MSKLIRLNELDRYKFDSPPEIFVYLLEHAIDWRRIRHSNILYTDGEGLSIAYKYFDINGKLSGFKIRDLRHGGKYSVTSIAPLFSTETTLIFLSHCPSQS